MDRPPFIDFHAIDQYGTKDVPVPFSRQNPDERYDDVAFLQEAFTPVAPLEITDLTAPPARSKPVYHTTIHDMPLDDRPRERLQKYGSETLMTSELLAILLRTGSQQENVIELATKLLRKYGSLSGLMRADFHELSAEYGLGQAKTATLKAALELGKRLCISQPEQRFAITSCEDAANLVRMDMMYLDHEEIHILLLDSQHRLVERIRRYKGTVNSSVMRVAEILRPAIVRNCPCLIVCHNHPSGDPSPSSDDIESTTALVQGGETFDIEIVDHLIIGNPRYTSLRQQMGW